MYPCRRATLHSLLSSTNASGQTITVYGTAKKAGAPLPYASPGTAVKVYAV